MTALLALALAGCALSPEDDPVLYAEGWRRVSILEVGRSGTLASPDAVLCAGRQVATGAMAAVVRYTGGSRHMRRWVTLVVPLQGDLWIDRAVYLNIRDCRVVNDLATGRRSGP